MEIIIGIGGLILVIGLWGAINSYTRVTRHRVDKWSKEAEVDLAEDSAKFIEELEAKVADGVKFMPIDKFGIKVDAIIKSSMSE